MGRGGDYGRAGGECVGEVVNIWRHSNEWDRYRPIIAVWGFATSIMGFIFGMPILWHGSPITPDLYGSAVYEIPALVWCAYQIFFGVVAGVGAACHRPRTCAIGLIAILLEFSGIGIMSTLQTQGGVVEAGSFVFVVMTGLFLQMAWRSWGA